MAEPSSISNPDTNSNPSPRKRRKIGTHPPAGNPSETSGSRWRSESEKQIYSSKLVDALRHLRRRDTAGTTVRSVRDAADRVLAAAAKGGTRWSRAILTGRLSLRLSQINKKHKRAARPAAGITKPAANKKTTPPPPLERKVRVLSRLVPGCRKVALPSLLDETSDYIAALEMQVKAMTFLAGFLNGGGGGESAAAGVGPVAFSSS